MAVSLFSILQIPLCGEPQPDTKNGVIELSKFLVYKDTGVLFFSVGLTNTGSKPIKAFRISLNKITDFNELELLTDLEYTSGSSFESSSGTKVPRNRSIKPGELFYYNYVVKPNFTNEYYSSNSFFQTISKGSKISAEDEDELRATGNYKLEIMDIVYDESSQAPGQNELDHGSNVPMVSKGLETTELGHAVKRYEIYNVEPGDLLNVRLHPTMQSDTVIGLRNGHEVEVLGSSEFNDETEWIPVSFKGESGWITRKFLKLKTN